MTPDQFIDKVEDVINNLPSDVLVSLEAAALVGIDALQSRLQRKGVDSKGNPWRDYSPAWKAKKQKEGKYSGHVDFTYKNRMLNSIFLHEKNINSTTASVVLRPTGEDNIDKMRKNIKLRGDIMKLSSDEITEVKKEEGATLRTLIKRRLA